VLGGVTAPASSLLLKPVFLFGTRHYKKILLRGSARYKHAITVLTLRLYIQSLFVYPSEDNFKKMFEMVVAKGYGGIKVYLTANLKKNDELHVNISETHAETW